MTDIYLLEPETPGAAWAPFAGTTPISELRAGGWRLRERWALAIGGRAAGAIATDTVQSVPDGIQVVAADSISGQAWVVDATFAPRLPMRAVGGAKRLLHAGKAVAWRLDPGEKWTGPHNDGDGVVVDGLQLKGTFDLVTAMERFLFSDTLAALDTVSDPVPAGVHILGNAEALLIRGAEVEPGVVIDVRNGAVILEPGVTVRSGTRLEGPLWLREKTIVAGGQLRQVSAGPYCRLHGEIASTVFTGYANKSHDGFLGHSVVGEWVNLGAGTITSNLKNTYGEIRLDIGTERIATGRTNLGSLIGNHARTAIGTLLPTGCVVGAGANLLGGPRTAKHVTPFSWGDTGEKVGREQFLIAAARILPRRDVAATPEVLELLGTLYDRCSA